MFIALALMVALLPPNAPQQRQPLEGEWVGTYETAQEEGEFLLKVGRSNGEWSVAVRATSSNNPNPAYQSATNVKVAGDTLSFSLNWGTRVECTGKRTDDVVSGQLEADHFSGRWSVKRKPE